MGSRGPEDASSTTSTVFGITVNLTRCWQCDADCPVSRCAAANRKRQIQHPPAKRTKFTGMYCSDLSPQSAVTVVHSTPYCAVLHCRQPRDSIAMHTQCGAVHSRLNCMRECIAALENGYNTARCRTMKCCTKVQHGTATYCDKTCTLLYFGNVPRTLAAQYCEALLHDRCGHESQKRCRPRSARRLHL